MSRVAATYRLQLNKDFRFEHAKEITDYLAALGITHAYASPYLAAEPGSMHGYNLVDPTRLNPEIGTERDFLEWTEALARHGMGHIVDVVPNHMAASQHNPWWQDLLESGPSSLRADYFDVEWNPPKEALRDKVLLPVLGAQYGEVLEKGELRLERVGGSFCVRYWERCLPVNPQSVVPVLERASASLSIGTDDPKKQELDSITTGLRNLPPITERDLGKRQERARETEVLKRRLATLCEDASIASAIDAAVARTNGTPGEANSFDDLDRLLGDQGYRLAFWRVATEEINYRRFFDINDLAAIRMESDAVFQDSNALLLKLVHDRKLHGLRLDHTDGLYDPPAFFAKLRAATEGRDVLVVAEKILSQGEELPTSWPIDGTTGYEFLSQVSALFVDRKAERAFTRLHHEVTGDPRSFADHVMEAKRAILRSSLAAELHMLAQRLERIAMRDRRSRDFTFQMLRRALSETIAAFPVYRTYIRPDGSHETHDEQLVFRAIRTAKRRNPEISPSVFDFLRDVLMLAKDTPDRDERVELVMRFQQLTGPVTAKGVEDTAFYTYVRFVALNEVGGSPERFGSTLEELHASNAARRAKWPRSMIATSTHDTKRGEDVRARLAVLSEMPSRWETWVREALTISERHSSSVEDEPAPSAPDKYLFLQTVVGALPFSGVDERFTARLVEYAIKAAREAKQRTSWLSPNEAYEDALRGYVEGMMSDAAFGASAQDFVDSIATHGASNGLVQTLLKIASPGITDTYQGSETWDYRLVDPDNRTPVDYAALREALVSLEGSKPRDLLASYRDGRVKLYLLREGLRQRSALPELFMEGAYEPIDGGDEIVAFARRHEAKAAIAVGVRQPVHVTNGAAPWACGDVWGDRHIAIPCGRWRDAFTGRELDAQDRGVCVADVLADLPVALLVLMN